MHRFPDGVWFLDLAPISDPTLALAEAAQVLGVREEPERTRLQSVCAFLKTRRVLMVFDNCEHLIASAAALAHAIIKAAPGVRLAASSREALHIPGEHTYPILPLRVPRVGDSIAALRRSTAVRLFVDRVQSHKPGFALTDDLAPVVAELVTRLEGIPLALELAAARVRTMSVADINRRLADRYKILTGGSRVLQARQQTLRGLVDWSYDLLQDAEKTLFNRLAVFRGGFDLSAVEGMCGADPLTPDDLLDLLGSLIEKSLVMQSGDEQGTRYRMLETLRDYAAEKLLAGGELPAVAAAHCRFFFDLAKQGRDGLRGPQQGQWLQRLELEHDNLRAAMALAQSDQGLVDPMVAVKLAVALQNFWVLRGHATEGRATVRALLGLPVLGGSDVARAHALYLGATLAWSQGDPAAALADLATCLALRRALHRSADHAVDLAATLSTIALAKLSAGDATGAREAALEALPLFRHAAHPVGESAVLLQLGQVEFFSGHDQLAREHLQAALALARRIKHPETEAEAELVLAQVAFESGDRAGAELGLARSLTQCLAAADRRGAANALWWLGKADLLAGRLVLACARLGEALTAFSAFDMHEQLPGCLEDHAALAMALQAPEAAVGLASAAHRLRDKSPLVRSSRAQARGLVLLAQLRAACSEVGFNRAWQEAEGWEADQVLRQALGLPPARAQAA
jgi:predicted ATPase